MLNPLVEEERRHVYNCDNERLSRSNKCWIFKSMWSLRLHCCSKLTNLNKSFIRFTLVCYCWYIDFHFQAPTPDAEQNELWLVALHVSHTCSCAVLGQWKLPLLPSVWRSGFTRLQLHRLNAETEMISSPLESSDLCPFFFHLTWQPSWIQKLVNSQPSLHTSA